jgi:hypothetical protein
MSTKDCFWGKDGRCVRLTTYSLVVPNVKKIRGLNLPGTPWATSAYCGRPLVLLEVVDALKKVNHFWDVDIEQKMVLSRYSRNRKF